MVQEKMSSFIPCNTFTGAKPNYKFQKGDQGVGYYPDATTPVLSLNITVPKDAEPGDQLQVQHPTTNEWINVTVPDGALAGETFTVDLTAIEAAATSTITSTTTTAPTTTQEETTQIVEEVNLQMPIGQQVALGGAAIQTVENSRCVQCGGASGLTHLLPTVIPYFKEIIVVSFKCPDCHWANTEIMETSTIQTQGSRIAFTASIRDDLDRRIIKSKHATIEIKELELTIPAMTQRGTMTTIEGVLQKTIDHLRQDQTRRREEHPELATKLDDFISQLVLYATGLQLPFTLILDDPTGNSHIENPNAPNWDPNMRTTQYNRTKPQNVMIGMKHLNNVPTEEYANKVKQRLNSTDNSTDSNSGTGKDLNETEIRDQSKAKREGWIEFDRAAGGEDKIAEKKLAQIPMDCPSCNKQGGFMKSCQTNIPHFKDVVILAYNCDDCGYRTNEIKAGGGVPEKGCRWTLVVTGTKPEDLHRDILKSNTARVTIKELGFEMEAGSLGGIYTTTEGLLGQIHDRLVKANPFAFGDGATSKMKSSFKKFLDGINEMRSGLVPFTLVLEDPMDHSFIYSPKADGFEDFDLSKEYYIRTDEENDDFGLNDMITEDYDDKGKIE